MAGINGVNSSNQTGFDEEPQYQPESAPQIQPSDAPIENHNLEAAAKKGDLNLTGAHMRTALFSSIDGDRASSVAAKADSTVRDGSVKLAPSVGAFNLDKILGVKGNPNVTPEFKAKAVKIAEELEVKPEYLFAVMSFESEETFSPSKLNIAGSGAVGLIQFLPNNAQALLINRLKDPKTDLKANQEIIAQFPDERTRSALTVLVGKLSVAQAKRKESAAKAESLKQMKKGLTAEFEKMKRANAPKEELAKINDEIEKATNEKRVVQSELKRAADEIKSITDVSWKSNREGALQKAIKVEEAVKVFKQMTSVEQLDYVKDFLMPYKGRMDTLENAYMAILLPEALRKPNDYVLFVKGTARYSQNPGLDRDKDGSITKLEATKEPRMKLEGKSKWLKP